MKFKDADAAALDAQTANTKGDFYHIGLNLSRLQNLGNQGTQSYVGIYGQYSPYNLDSAEQYLSGGPFNARGYESSQFAGSTGYFATLELRQVLFRDAKNQIEANYFLIRPMLALMRIVGWVSRVITQRELVMRV